MELFHDESGIELYMRDVNFFYRFNSETKQWDGPYIELYEKNGMHFLLPPDGGEVKMVLSF